MSGTPYSCSKLPLRGGSAFQADELGNRIIHPPPSKAPYKSCPIVAESCYPCEFEAATIPSFLASLGPSPPSTPSVSVRIVKSINYKGNVVSIGTALSTLTWVNEGFVMLGTEGAKTAVLSSETSVGYCYLDTPRALIQTGDTTVVIAGNGYIIDLDGNTTPSLPAVACVDLCTLSVFIQVGNGETLIDEEYNDIKLDVACSAIPTYLVCGRGKVTEGGDLQAVFRKLSTETYLPTLFSTSAVSYVTITSSLLSGVGAVFDRSNAISLIASQALDLIVIAVQASITVGASTTESSLLWSLSLEGVPLSPLSVTSFNNPATNFLVTPANVLTLSIVSLVVTAEGNTFAVSRGFTSLGAMAPAYITVVHAFNTDTIAIPTFGVSGITSWWDARGYPSVPTGAVVRTTDNSLLVVGNIVSSVVTDGSVDPSNSILVPNLPWLSVQVPLSTDYSMNAIVGPYLIGITCSGNACPLLTDLVCDPCSTLIWASSFVFLAATFQGVLVGDCNTKPLALSQPAAILSAKCQLFKLSSGCRVVNINRYDCGVLQSLCDGVVTVDTVCSPTTLLVNGPIVVGDISVSDSLPLAGAIRFKDGRFQGFNGSNWVYLDCCPSPIVE